MSTTEAVSLSQSERTQIAETMATCPFVGAAVAHGKLPVLNTAANPLANIADIVRLGDAGGGDLGSKLLWIFARGNHSRWLTAPDNADLFVPKGTFSLLFGGSQGAHPGHSAILLGDPNEVGGGRFAPDSFERLATHANHAGRLSLNSVGDFIADNLRRDPNAQVFPLFKMVRYSTRLLSAVTASAIRKNTKRRTVALTALTALLGADHLVATAGEWALLFTFLKNSPNSQDGSISLSDVRDMFVAKRLPDGWDTWKKSTTYLFKTALYLTIRSSIAYHVTRR